MLHIKKVSVIIVAFFIAVIALVEFSDFHHNFIRSKVGEKIVTIEEDGAGGTGFHVQASSGQVFIMTNAHVCELQKIDGSISVKAEGKDTFIKRRVVFVSDKYDLCLIEGIPGHQGLKIASSVNLGEEVTLVGHPNLRPILLSTGEIINKDATITIPKFIIFTKKDLDRCKNNIIMEYASIFKTIKICVEKDEAYQASMISYPGNSGSPVVNKYGNLIGVLFAGNRSIVNDAYLIKLEQIKEVLDLY